VSTAERADVVRLSGPPGGAGVFAVPSRSHPGAGYRVDYAGAGAAVCRCAGFSYRGRCRHLGEVRRAVALESLERRERARLRLREIAEELACD
jgi:hypothetical protein